MAAISSVITSSGSQSSCFFRSIRITTAMRAKTATHISGNHSQKLMRAPFASAGIPRVDE
jgi:hypothetical protein